MKLYLEGHVIKNEHWQYVKLGADNQHVINVSSALLTLMEKMGDVFRVGHHAPGIASLQPKYVPTLWAAENEQAELEPVTIRGVLDGTEYNPASRAGMWANKSIRSAYHLGLLSADRNGMYEWVIGPTEKSCKDCVRVVASNGIVRR